MKTKRKIQPQQATVTGLATRPDGTNVVVTIPQREQPAAEQDPMAALHGGFTVEDRRPERDYYIVTCRHCKDRWSLQVRRGRVHGGNILHLLEHQAAHTSGASKKTGSR